MIRNASRPGGRLRVWSDGDGPAGAALDAVAVEWVWAGRAGHPSSYGLLGGRLAEDVHIAAPDAGSFKSSLAGVADEVEFGLPNEYRGAVTSGLLLPVEVVVAAHGRFGSSERVFGQLAATLSELLTQGVPESDADLWALWDSSAQSA